MPFCTTTRPSNENSNHAEMEVGSPGSLLPAAGVPAVRINSIQESIMPLASASRDRCAVESCTASAAPRKIRHAAIFRARLKHAGELQYSFGSWFLTGRSDGHGDYVGGLEGGEE